MEKEDDKYKKFYNFVFDLYVVWLLVFWRNVLNVSNFYINCKSVLNKGGLFPLRVLLWFTTHCNLSLHDRIHIKNHKVKASSYQLNNPDNQTLSWWFSRLQLEARVNMLTNLEELVEEQQVNSLVCSAYSLVCPVTGEVLGQVSKCGTNKNVKLMYFICQKRP